MKVKMTIHYNDGSHDDTTHRDESQAIAVFWAEKAAAHMPQKDGTMKVPTAYTITPVFDRAGLYILAGATLVVFFLLAWWAWPR